MFLLSTSDDKKRLTKRILAAREDPQQREELLREQDFLYADAPPRQPEKALAGKRRLMPKPCWPLTMR